MAGYISDDTRKVTTHRLVEMKQRGEKISMLCGRTSVLFYNTTLLKYGPILNMPLPAPPVAMICCNKNLLGNMKAQR